MNIRFDFTGAIAMVTGGAGGIGKAVVEALAEAGAAVVFGDVKEEAGRNLAAELTEGGAKVWFVPTDVTQQQEADKLLQTAIDTAGLPDVLVNAAGVSGRFNGLPLTNTTDADFDLCYQVNVKGIYHTMKACYPYFCRRQRGKIINVTSVVGHSTNPAIPHYAASKAAAINLTLTAAKELGMHNVNVNTVCPGYVYTPMYESAAADMKQVFPAFSGLTGEEIVAEFARQNCVLQRPQTGADLANAVLYLASNAGDNITGLVLDVAGGYKL